ncbi:hypothetical protein BESB_005980 [Besnoitia besnoiti]|uniref:Uncharacterized protein n=1 Tax=Besnoitia besnoiti TaxID=94643 RepID=A0A2A9MQ39_BESBE|nr:hypothetical protein BESB_005980 [Besnoitia besnoiti]PFH38257.1 hypothetical protein BESB_005980 [Besnoitia besnoiti]
MLAVPAASSPEKRSVSRKMETSTVSPSGTLAQRKRGRVDAADSSDVLCASPSKKKLAVRAEASAVEGQDSPASVPPAARPASPGLARRLPVSSLTPGSLLGASTASLADDTQRALFAASPPLSDAIPRGRDRRRSAADVAYSCHWEPRGGTPTHRGLSLLGGAAGGPSSASSDVDLDGCRTPPRRGIEDREASRSLSRLDAVLPSTPSRLPSLLSYDALPLGRPESPRQSPVGPLGPSVSLVPPRSGEGTPIGGSRRPRDSFEFALADEAATPSPFSRSKRRNRSDSMSPMRPQTDPSTVGPAGLDGDRGRGSDGAGTGERRERPDLEPASPFRRSPITGKRQCVLSPMRLTPVRQSPACFREDRRTGRALGADTVARDRPCPTWLVSRLVEAPAARPPQGDDGALAYGGPHFLASLFSLSGAEDGLGAAPSAGGARERVNGLLHAITSLKLEVLERLPLGQELERLWRHFRTLRIVCDREHDAARPLGLSSRIFPALQRLTQDPGISSSLPGAASILTSGSPLSALKRGGSSFVSSANGLQSRSGQLNEEDIARMLWLAPHLFGWRFRQNKSSVAGQGRLSATPLTASPLSRRLRPAGSNGDDREGEEQKTETPLSPLRRNPLVLVSRERLADNLELELLEFVLAPEEAQAAAVRVAAKGDSADTTERRPSGTENEALPPQVVLVSREANPTVRLAQFRGVLVLWVFVCELEYLKTSQGASHDVSLLSALLEKAWSALTQGRWVSGFNPDTAPLPPFHALPARPAKTLLRSPSKGSRGRLSGEGHAAKLALLLARGPRRPAPRRRGGGARRRQRVSPVWRGGLHPPLDGGQCESWCRSRCARLGWQSLAGGAEAVASEGETLVYRLSAADMRLSASSVASHMLADGAAQAVSGLAAARGSLSPVAKIPRQGSALAALHSPCREADAVASPTSSLRSASSPGTSPISERLRQRTEARRQARLQQEEMRKQRAGLHQDARQWANVKWVMSCLLDACVYRDPRKTIDTRVLVEQYISKSKLPLRLDVVEECLATLANLAPDMLSLNGSVVAFASGFDAVALRKLVDTRLVEAQRVAAAFEKVM